MQTISIVKNNFLVSDNELGNFRLLKGSKTSDSKPKDSEEPVEELNFIDPAENGDKEATDKSSTKDSKKSDSESDDDSAEEDEEEEEEPDIVEDSKDGNG